jgi:DNA-3-methyladenine glycosylase
VKPLGRRFYERDALDLARALIGHVLVREVRGVRVAGRIVEAEAYRRDDPASHSFRGPTRRNATMFGPSGRAYVYVSHGIHHCVNVVGRGGGAALLRAVEPVEGLEVMAARRGPVEERLLCAGPGRLCSAFGITLADDGADLTLGHGLWIARGRSPRTVMATRRVGLTVAAEVPWRFVDPESRYLSRGVSRTRSPA